MASSYNVLEPNITQELGGKSLEFDASKPVELFTTTSFLYTAAIMAIVVVAAGRYMLAGVWRIEASERGVRKSNEEIKRVTLGLLGVLSLFVILYTFNKGLLTGEVGLEGLKTKTGSVAATVPAATSTPPVATNGTEKANRDALAAQGITVNKDACTAAQMQETKPSCTNLANLDGAVMSMLIQLKDSCPGSSIVVTGGTEPGHKNHFAGRAVDVRIGDGSLDSCIRKFPTNKGLGFCDSTYGSMGFVFCDEKTESVKDGVKIKTGDPHWHIFK